MGTPFLSRILNASKRTQMILFRATNGQQDYVDLCLPDLNSDDQNDKTALRTPEQPRKTPKFQHLIPLK
jgi:hypothetical protein